MGLGPLACKQVSLRQALIRLLCDLMCKQLIMSHGASTEKMGYLRCPKCRSSRVRRGYEKPPLLLRLIGMHGLLCDNCNLSYQGFAVPGTVPKHSSRGYRQARKPNEPTPRVTDSQDEELEEVKYAHRLRAEDASANASDVISFAWYYVKLRIRVVAGMHQTSHSLGIKYRWHNWQHWQRSKRL